MSAPTRSTTQRDAGSEPAYTVFSAYSGKVYACWVNAGLAIAWMAPYHGRLEELLALEVCGSQSCA